MQRKPKVGVLPLYLKLYDDTTPEKRQAFGGFLAQVSAALAAAGLDTGEAGICRVRGEFEQAVATFEREKVDLIVTLHLAYSPSLEAVDTLCATRLPILILDTTMDYGFGVDVDPERIMYNHGIHGVMDLASMLRRRGKRFEIVAGHIEHSDVVDRAAAMARAACAACSLRGTRAVRIGPSFEGMGDFAVPEAVLRDVLGVTVDQAGIEDLASCVEGVPDREIRAEFERDRDRFECTAPEDVHVRSLRVGLGLRKLLAESGYSAFSMNFLAFDQPAGPVDTVPFLEASKAMSRGVGYGGEGDVLTASLVGALSRGFDSTTFTEVFCPDWKGNSLFLSHMGEVNPDVAACRPRLIEKPFPFTPAQNPAVITCSPRPGPAVFVNLAPGPADSFTLILAPVEVLEDQSGMHGAVRGWVRPEVPVVDFLERYSACGGTHHSALVLGTEVEALAAFSRWAGLPCRVIGGAQMHDTAGEPA